MATIDDMSCGKAGEYLVCADLILQGHCAFPSEQGLSFDLVASILGKLYRVQVKTTRQPKPIPQRTQQIPAYIFNVKRMGKHGAKTYADGDVDLFALVALDHKTIGYFSPSQIKRTMSFRLREYASQYWGEKFDADKARVVALREAGQSMNKIAKDTGLDKAYVSRLTRHESPEKTWRYLDEFTLEHALTR